MLLTIIWKRKVFTENWAFNKKKKNQKSYRGDDEWLNDLTDWMTKWSNEILKPRLTHKLMRCGICMLLLLDMASLDYHVYHFGVVVDRRCVVLIVESILMCLGHRNSLISRCCLFLEIIEIISYTKIIISFEHISHQTTTKKMKQRLRKMNCKALMQWAWNEMLDL